MKANAVGTNKGWIRDLPDFSQDLVSLIRSRFGVQKKIANLWLTCKSILDEYEEDRLTVRQLYYQLVGRGYIVNTQNSYNNLVNTLTKARKEEFLPWDRFIDRSRAVLAGDQTVFRLDQKTPQQAAVDQVREAFDPSDWWSLPVWWNQLNHVEVWTEKDALSGIMESICERWGVKLVVSRGYTSYTFRREAEDRLTGATCKILYFGDLDPSGVDIPRMLQDDLINVDMIRVALTPDQAQGLPPNPIKESDTRSQGFKRMYPELAGTCYELDALPPPELRELVEASIEAEFDSQIADKRDQRIEEWREGYTDHLSLLRKAVDWNEVG